MYAYFDRCFGRMAFTFGAIFALSLMFNSPMNQGITWWCVLFGWFWGSYDFLTGSRNGQDQSESLNKSE